MKYIIVEDEKIAADRLERLVGELRSDYQLIEKIDSVKNTVAFLGANHELDLIFLDIQLSDGISFKIFEEISIKAWISSIP